jgi:hypothetical protein
MSVLILIALGVCFSTSILFLVLYIKIIKKCSQTNSNLQKTELNYSTLLENFNNLKKELTMSNRKGYYDNTVNLMSPEDYKNNSPGELYRCILYVKELDRYTNGMSKIELTDVELISGFDNTQFDYVKRTMRTKFSSLRKTSDIEWLESEDSIKEVRKQKLKKILEIGQN